MIEFCLETIQCDPDVEIKSNNETKKSVFQQITDDEYEIDQQANENVEPMDDNNDQEIRFKPKETSIFSLLRTVQFIDSSLLHPLEILLKKLKI